MSKIIFFNIPAHGHTNPTLALVSELVKRGETVIYYSFDEFKTKIEMTGAKYRSYNIDISKLNRPKHGNFATMYRLLMQGSELVLENLLPEIKNENPDCIIHDSFCPWGKYIASILNIPAISSVTIFVFNRQSIDFFKILFVVPFLLFWGIIDLILALSIKKRIQKKYRIPKTNFEDIFLNKEKLNILYTSKDFHPKSKNLDNSFIFVGPSIIERNENCTIPLLTSRPVLYISFGTLVTNNERFYRMCFDAFSEMDIQVVLSIGNTTNIPALKNIPSNFIIRNYVPQLEILSHANCFITHGGMNSVHEGLFYGVPLIVIPQQKEQEVVAERVQATHTGIFLRSVHKHTLQATVKKVLSDESYRIYSTNLGASLKSAGGYQRAADEIQQFIIRASSFSER